MSPRRVLNPFFTNAIATRRVMADLVINFVVMSTGVGRGWIWMTSFNSSTLKTVYLAQAPRRYFLYELSYSRFSSNFVAMATGVGRRRNYLASFNSPSPKTPVGRKDLRDICYTRRVIADFVSNFVAMVTGVIRR